MNIHQEEYRQKQNPPDPLPPEPPNGFELARGRIISRNESVQTTSDIIKRNGSKQHEIVDSIRHPKHYTHGKYECWDVILDWNLPYLPATALKYINRHLHKGKPIEDIKKAIVFLEKYIEVLEEK